MSKLVCTEHARRVLVLPSTTVVHREDGRVCDSPHVRQGTVVVTAQAVVERDKKLHSDMQTSEGRLLLAIFGAPELTEEKS